MKLVILCPRAHQLGCNHMDGSVKPHDRIPVLYLTFGGKNQLQVIGKKTTLKDDCTLDSAVSELRSVRIRSICTAEMIRDSAMQALPRLWSECGRWECWAAVSAAVT